MVHVPILLYHSIAEEATPAYRRYAVHPRTFAAQMAYLHDRGYTPITVSQLAGAITGASRGFPGRPVVITFDDGLHDFYTDALPILQEHGFTATLYIITGLVEGTSRWLTGLGEGARPMLTWAQVAEIAARGIECGAHTHTHPQLDTLPAHAAYDEIIRSKAVLEQRLGRPVASFSYPYGYYSAAIRQMVERAGYTSACAVKHAMSTTGDDRFALARIWVYADTDLDAFAALLSGSSLPVAPRRELVRTTGWRYLRRGSVFLKQGLRRDMTRA